MSRLDRPRATAHPHSMLHLCGISPWNAKRARTQAAGRVRAVSTGVKTSVRAGLALVSVATLTMIACKPNVSTVIEPAPEPAAAEPVLLVEAPQASTVTCKARTPAGAPLLIPDGAEWMVHMNPSAVLRSPAYATFAADIEQSSMWASMVQVVGACGYSLDRIEHVLVGFNEAEDFAAVVIAPGIGRPDLARCLGLQIQATISEQDQPLAEVIPMPGDPSVLVIEFTDGRAYLFGDDMLALSTTAWQPEVDQLTSCAGTPAVYGSLNGLVRGFDVEAPMWLVGIPQAQLLAPITASLGIDAAGIRGLGVSVRLDEGAAMAARMHMTDPTTATDSADVLRTMVGMMSSAMPPELSGVASRIIVDAVDSELRLNVSLRLDELRHLATQI
jgi:hypothetical protein